MDFACLPNTLATDDAISETIENITKRKAPFSSSPLKAFQMKLSCFSLHRQFNNKECLTHFGVAL